MARYTSTHKEESRARIVAAAGRAFRKQGYSGIGIDGLARKANLTHGGFYGHFASKAEAFEAAIVDGLQTLRVGIENIKADHGKSWVEAFIAFYMGNKRTCDLEDACTLPSLSTEIERSDLNIRIAYQTELQKIIDTIATGLSSGTDTDYTNCAWGLLSLLAGGVTLARAVPNQVVSEQIAMAVQNAALVFLDKYSCDMEATKS